MGIFLYLIDRFNQFIDVEMCVNAFCQRHCAGMTDDFFDNCLIDMCVSHHGDGGMTAAVGRSVNMQAVQQRLKEVAVIIVIGKVFAAHGVDQVFATGAVVVPAFIEGENFGCDGNFSNSVCGLAVHDIKVALLKMHIFFLEIKKLRDTHAVVDQHKNCLVIPVVFVFPQ